MKLIDILEIYSENDKLTVVDTLERVVSAYDGKNSIDEDLNDCEVIKIEPLNYDEVVVMIDM